MQQPSYVGIDVSKHHLDVAFPNTPKVWRTPNDAGGIAALIRRVRRLDHAHVVCEATGGYTRRLTGDLAAGAGSAQPGQSAAGARLHPCHRPAGGDGRD